MKSLYILQEKYNEPYIIKDVPVPSQLEPYHLLLQTGAAGFCHTDELIRTGGFPGALEHNVIGSHEPAGTIVAMGEDAVKAGWKTGQRVGALGYINFCGTSLSSILIRSFQMSHSPLLCVMQGNAWIVNRVGTTTVWISGKASLSGCLRKVLLRNMFSSVGYPQPVSGSLIMLLIY